MTSVWDVLRFESTVLAAEGGESVIYTISDGRENASKSTKETAERALIDKSIRLFSFSIIEPILMLTENADVGKYPGSDLLQMSQDTGGLALIGNRAPRSALDEDGRLTDLGKLQIRSQLQQVFRSYRMEIELSAPAVKGEEWKLKLTGNRKHDLVLWPHKLAACPAPAQPTQ